jgi:glyoxylate reductase
MAEGLADCPNAVLLPHLGSASIATRAAMSRMAGENALAVLQGRRPANLVNPEAWAAASASGEGEPVPP